jgi:hypothetical protein
MPEMYLKSIMNADLLSKSKFDKKVLKGWTPSFRDKMRAWEMYAKGCTEQDIARTLGVPFVHFNKFRLEFKRFFEQMRRRRPQDLPKEFHRNSVTEGNPLLTPQAIRLFALSGFTKRKIAELAGTTYQSVTNYFTRHPELEQIYLSFSDVADAKVIGSLFKRAVGMKVKRTKFATHEGKIKDSQVYDEQIPPSVDAAMHWLVNRKRWKKSDNAVLTSNKGSILEAVEQLTNIDNEELERLDKENSID